MLNTASLKSTGVNLGVPRTEEDPDNDIGLTLGRGTCIALYLGIALFLTLYGMMRPTYYKCVWKRLFSVRPHEI